MESVQFIQTSPTQLADLINEGVKKQLEQLKKELQNQSANDDLMSREQACKFLQIDSSTLWHWTNKGKVKAYGIGARRYYKRSELLEALTLKRQ
ncbi:MAG: helix-turn-helix domain-containing protein [Vicingaceae bacterium]|nr:helix-turn-helix domain-containing protein [Vicingaceae bacterium]